MKASDSLILGKVWRQQHLYVVYNKYLSLFVQPRNCMPSEKKFSKVLNKEEK